MEGRNMIVYEALTADNYWYWSDLVKNYLQAKGIWDVVVNDDDRNMKEWGRKEWERKNAKALHAIRLACGSEHAILVRGCDKAKDVWNHLKFLFDHELSLQQNGLTTIDENYREIIELIERGDATVLLSYEPEANLRQAIVSTLYPGNNSLIHEAVSRNNEEIVKILVHKASNDVLKLENNDGYTPLALAVASFGNKSVVEAIIGNMGEELKKEMLCSKAQKGKHKNLIPIVMAADVGHKDMTNFLYDQTVGANSQIFGEENHHQAASLLYRCINNEILDMVLRLIRSPAEEWAFITTGPIQNSPLFVLARKSEAFSVRW